MGPSVGGPIVLAVARSGPKAGAKQVAEKKASALSSSLTGKDENAGKNEKVVSISGLICRLP